MNFSTASNGLPYTPADGAEDYYIYNLLELNGLGGHLARVIIPQSSPMAGWFGSNIGTVVKFSNVEAALNVIPEINVGPITDISSMSKEWQTSHPEFPTWFEKLDNVMFAVPINEISVRVKKIADIPELNIPDILNFGASLAVVSYDNNIVTNPADIDFNTAEDIYLVSDRAGDWRVQEGMNRLLVSTTSTDIMSIIGFGGSKQLLYTTTNNKKIWLLDNSYVSVAGNVLVNGVGFVDNSGFMYKLISRLKPNLFIAEEMLIIDDTNKVFLNRQNEIVVRKEGTGSFEDRFQFEYYDWDKQLKLTSLHHGLGTTSDYKEAWTDLTLFDLKQITNFPGTRPTTANYTKRLWFGNSEITLEARRWKIPYNTNGMIYVEIIAKTTTTTPEQLWKLELSLVNETDAIQGIEYMSYTKASVDIINLPATEWKPVVSVQAGTTFNLFGQDPIKMTSVTGKMNDVNIEEADKVNYLNNTKIKDGYFEVYFPETNNDNTALVTSAAKLYFGYMPANVENCHELWLSGIDWRYKDTAMESTIEFEQLDFDGWDNISISLIKTQFLPLNINNIVNYHNETFPEGNIKVDVKKTGEYLYTTIVTISGTDYEDYNPIPYTNKFEFNWIVENNVWNINSLKGQEFESGNLLREVLYTK
ncbi:MAG: hypothetical protein M0R46_15040 [Candidatus Muirbacterium halophilum]|nr:hypothetical protein [Candidatus Muirbacterium halophilum]MCK9477231.1 hypothetical protein [Candidatus Muirbacterium halophilum]